MRDPIDQLESFSMPGTTAPLPAAEVRRRGDRIRRRNTALAAAGGLAVVVAVAAPIAAVALHHDARRVQPAPAPPSYSWREDIPRSFDLAAVPAGSSPTFTVRRDGSVVDDLSMCGATAYSTRSDDPAGAAVATAGASAGEPGTESSSGRTLAVYRDADTASTAVEALRSTVEGCPVDERQGGPTFTWSVVPDASVAGADDGFVVAQQVRLDRTTTSDLTAFEVARVGNAVLISSSHTSAGGQQAIEGTVPNLLTLTAPVVGQMCVFSGGPCPAG